MELLTGKVIRVSIGYFPADQQAKIESMAGLEFRQSVEPAIRKLKGNLGFYVGVDVQKRAISNVSVWDTLEDAQQLDTLKEMLAMKTIFEAFGVQFLAIPNALTHWEL